MKKYILILLGILVITFNCTAHDTIVIDNDAFKLEVQVSNKDSIQYYNKITPKENQITEFYSKGHLISIVKYWLKYLGLEYIDYEFVGVPYKDKNTTTNTEFYSDKIFEVVMTNKQEINIKENSLVALEQFIVAVGLKFTKTKKIISYWEVKLVDNNSSAISIAQDEFWKRTAYEEFIYYERIDLKRIANLLGRKLDNLVKPIDYTDLKFDIKMPNSDDFIDLKYAMIEHGLELTEVSKEIEFLVIDFDAY
jgi:hypothetical protein